MLATPLYAAILGLVFIGLSFRTLSLRRKYKVSIGCKENNALERAIRVHGNFSEYVPLTLLLVFFLESLTQTDVWIHGLCVLLVLGRIVHAFGVSQPKEDFRFRVFGMVCTLTALGGASLRIVILYL